MKKNMIVTGACGGIGRFLTNYYAENGYQVIAVDLMGKEDAPFTHASIDYYQLDQSISSDVRSFFTMLLERYGVMHVLINNAAIARYHCDIFSMTDEAFTQIVQTNLCGLFYCSRAFIHANQGADYGRIINIASTRWAQNEMGWDAYGASKGGVVALTSSMAISLSQTPITVNCISPGWIATENYENLTQLDHEQHPSGRVGVPSDIASAIDYILGDSNVFLNGQNLVVDGGMSKMMIYQE